jgi:hypothetical protein
MLAAVEGVPLQFKQNLNPGSDSRPHRFHAAQCKAASVSMPATSSRRLPVATTAARAASSSQTFMFRRSIDCTDGNILAMAGIKGPL